MPKVESSVVIEQPIDKVFLYTTNPANYLNWQPWVLDAQSEHRISIGTRIEVLGQIMGRKVDMTTQVVEYVPNKRLLAQGVPGSFYSKIVYTFERDENRTRVNFVGDFQPRGLLNLLSAMVVGRFRRDVEDSLLRLKGVLEAEY